MQTITQNQTAATPEAKEKLNTLIDELADDLRDSVKEIEKSIPSTQNNYGRYMALLGQLSGNNRKTASINNLSGNKMILQTWKVKTFEDAIKTLINYKKTVSHERNTSS